MKMRSELGSLYFLCAVAVSFIFIIPSTVGAPAVEEDESEGGCYYMFAHYEEGDRILTNEPCLNCTCHNSMLMCYLRVCPFTKPIGQDCTVEKKPDQCCPTITCPEVPVSLVTPPGLISSTSTVGPLETTAVALPSQRGCEIEGEFYPDGAQVATAVDKPCELCYCIRNRTACVMQECILHVEGCEPVFQRGVCCPVRYQCDFPPAIETTTIAGLISTTISTLFTTPSHPGGGCMREGEFYRDGSQIPTPGEAPCEHCYCMRGEIVCAVQDCGSPLETDGGDCKAIPPRVGLCCPEKYTCPNATEGYENATTKASVHIEYPLTTTRPETTSFHTHTVPEQHTTPAVADERVITENGTSPHSIVESTESFEAMSSTTHAEIHGLSTEKPTDSSLPELQDEEITTEREQLVPTPPSSDAPKIPAIHSTPPPAPEEEYPVTQQSTEETTGIEGITESVFETSPQIDDGKDAPLPPHATSDTHQSSTTPSSVEETSKEVSVSPQVTETAVTSEATENPLADETESTDSRSTESIPAKSSSTEVSILPSTAGAYNLSTTTEILTESGEGTTVSLDAESQVSQGTEVPETEVKPQSQPPVHSTLEPESVTETGGTMEKVGAPQNLLSTPPPKTTLGTTELPNVTEVIPEHHTQVPELNLTQATAKVPISDEITTEPTYHTTGLPIIGAIEVSTSRDIVNATHRTTTPITVSITTEGSEEPETTTILPGTEGPERNVTTIPKEIVSVSVGMSTESGLEEVETTTIISSSESPERNTSKTPILIEVSTEESKEPETTTIIPVTETVGQEVSHPSKVADVVHTTTKTPISTEESSEGSQEQEATTTVSETVASGLGTSPASISIGFTTEEVETSTILPAATTSKQNVSHPIEIVSEVQTTARVTIPVEVSTEESTELEATTIHTPSEAPQQNVSSSTEEGPSSESQESGSDVDRPSSGSTEEQTESPGSAEQVTSAAQPEKTGGTSTRPAGEELSDAVSESEGSVTQTTPSSGVEVVTESVTEQPRETTEQEISQEPIKLTSTSRPVEKVTTSVPVFPQSSAAAESGESSTEGISGSVEESTQSEETPTGTPLPPLSHSTESEELKVSSTTVRVEAVNATVTESSVKPETPSEETFTPSSELSDEYPSTTEVELSESTPVSLSRVPGEGSCFVEGVTYRNGSRIPPSTPCQLACACQNSIVHCLLVHCPGAPYSNGVDKCRPTYEPATCCPTYNCTQEGTTPEPVIITPESSTGGSSEGGIVTITPEFQGSTPASSSEQPPAEMRETTPKVGPPGAEQPSSVETTTAEIQPIEVSHAPTGFHTTSTHTPAIVQETTLTPTESKVGDDTSDIPESEVTESPKTTHLPHMPSQIGSEIPVSISPSPEQGTTEDSTQRVTESSSVKPHLVESTTTAQALETSSPGEESAVSHPHQTIGTGNETAPSLPVISSTTELGIADSSSVESIPAHDDAEVIGSQPVPEETTPISLSSTTLGHEEPIITTSSPSPILLQNGTVEGVLNETSHTTAKYPVTTTTTVTPSPASWPYPSTTTTGAPAMSSGACLFDSRVYMSAQQIPRDDPCDFCFCFRGDIICLQQSCPPPIPGCYEEPIPGFCCPRYECPVGSNNTTAAGEAPPSYYNNPQLLPTHSPGSVGTVAGGGPGCEIQGEYYEAGQLITATSGPCLECRCGSGGMMECDPRECQPEPMLRKMIEAIASR